MCQDTFSHYFYFLFSQFQLPFAVGPNNLGPNKFAPNKIIQPYFDYTFIADDNILRARDQLIKIPVAFHLLNLEMS